LLAGTPRDNGTERPGRTPASRSASRCERSTELVLKEVGAVAEEGDVDRPKSRTCEVTQEHDSLIALQRANKDPK
jgi:hypothetical protein